MVVGVPVLSGLTAAFVVISFWIGPAIAQTAPGGASVARASVARASVARLACGAATPSGSVACYVDPSINPNALCNDGTQPMFWYRAGYGPGVNTWVIWAQGGGECDSTAYCAVRITKPQQLTLLSSNGFKAGPGQGLLSAESTISPALYNANIAYMHYCSSDDWTGQKLGAGGFDVNNSDTWNFEGRHIIYVQVKSIAELPGFAQAQTVIYGGDSSGAVGSTLTFGDIKKLLPASARVLLVNDAGFSMDIGQYDRSLPAPYVSQTHPNAFETNIQTRFSYWKAHGDSKCWRAYPKSDTTDQINCYNTSFVLQNGYIKVPVFVAISQIDTSQLTQELCPADYGYCPVPTNPASAEGQYASAFGVQMVSLVSGGAGAVGPDVTYVDFAPDQYMHVILNDSALFDTPLSFTTGPIAPMQAFDAWLANPDPSPISYIGNAPGVD